MLGIIRDLYENYSENTFFLQAFMKNIFSVTFTVYPKTKTRCAYNPVVEFDFYYRLMLKSCIKIWPHSVSHSNTWNVCKKIFQVPISMTKNVVKSLQLFEIVQRATYCNQRNRGLNRVPNFTDNIHSRKKSKKSLFSSVHEAKSTQTSGSVLADEKYQVKKTKFELQPIETVESFLDKYRYYTKNLVTFETAF